MHKFFFVLGIAAFLGGCALDPLPEGAAQEGKEYSTGSNLPKRDRTATTTMSKDQVEQMQKGEGRSVNSGPR